MDDHRNDGTEPASPSQDTPAARTPWKTREGRVLSLVGRAEYKRRQAPPVLKVSRKAFGTGRRMPIARKIYEA